MTDDKNGSVKKEWQNCAYCAGTGTFIGHDRYYKCAQCEGRGGQYVALWPKIPGTWRPK